MFKQLTLAACLATALGTLPAFAAGTPVSGPDRATLVVSGIDVLALAPVGRFTADTRIAEVQRRLIRFLQVEKPHAHAVTPRGVEMYNVKRDLAIVGRAGEPVIVYKGQPLVTITKLDASAQNMTVDQLAANALYNLQVGLAMLTPQPNTQLTTALGFIAIETHDRTYTAADQSTDEGS